MSDAIKALVKAQKEMGPALKSSVNPHLRSKYADLGAVMEACFDALHNNGFAVMQPGGCDEHGTYVETVFAHESGEMFPAEKRVCGFGGWTITILAETSTYLVQKHYW